MKQAVLGTDNPAFQKADRTQKIGNKAVGRPVIENMRRVHLHELAMVHHPDPACQCHRLFLIMGYDDEGCFQTLLNVDKFKLCILAQFLVERGKGFIQKQQFRTARQRPRQSHTLALAT